MSSVPIPTGANDSGIAAALMILFTIFGVVKATRRKRQLRDKVPVAVHGQVPIYSPAPFQAPLVPALRQLLTTPPLPPHPSEYYSAPLSTPVAPLQRPRDDQREDEMNRLRQRWTL